MQIKTRSRYTVFIFSVLVWFALTGLSLQEIIAGIIFAALISLLAGHFLITTEKRSHLLKRIYFMVIYFFIFLWEMIKANIHVAYLVLHPLCPIKPGIVKIKTSLTKDSALTVLCNSITLTPGTLSLDINKEKQEIYIHWIDVKTVDIEEATRQIAGKFDNVLKEIFE